jgi:hypothetical protein
MSRSRVAVSRVILVMIVIVGGSILGPGRQDAAAQTVLPACQIETLGNIFLSPRFEHDSTIFWAARSSLWRSLDGGQTWLLVFQADAESRPINIRQFAMVPNQGMSGLSLFLGVDDNFYHQYSLWRSGDTGATWHEATAACSSPTGTFSECPWFSLRAAEEGRVLFQPRFWYGGLPPPYGIARSSDGGMTWDQVWDETSVFEVEVSPDFDHDETAFAVLWEHSANLDSSMIASQDGGDTWQAIDDELCDRNFWYSDLVLSPNFGRDATLLFGLYKNSLFISRDAGQSWQAIFPNGSTPVCDYSSVFRGLTPRFAPGYPDDPTIYVATVAGLFVSHDDGQSWRQMVAVSNVPDFAIGWRSEERAGVASRVVVETDQSSVPSLAAGQVYLPLVAVDGVSAGIRPYTLLLQAWPVGMTRTYSYRSDDGGVTWRCIEPPRVQKRVYLPLLLAS